MSYRKSEPLKFVIKMKFGARTLKLSKRISTAIGSETPLRKLAGNLSQFAKYALAEANSLSIEKIDIKLARLPKKLEGFRLVHLSDIHHHLLAQNNFHRPFVLLCFWRAQCFVWARHDTRSEFLLASEMIQSLLFQIPQNRYQPQ